MARVLAVSSGKGGTGKTTIACGLAIAFGKLGRKTILVELDSGHRCCDYLFHLDDAIAFDLSDVKTGHCQLLESVYPTSQKNVDLIAAPHSLDISFSPEILQGICNELSLYYDQVILDVPCHYFAIKALSSSVDTVLMVCTPEPICVRACHRLSVTLEEMGMKDMRLVINCVPKLEKDRRRLKVTDLDQVMDQVALPLGAVFPRCKEMEAFACDGTPLPEKSTAEKIFYALAERLMGKSVPLILR